MFQLNSRERRQCFRIKPSEVEPIILRSGDKEINVLDIGAAGLSFDNKNFSLGPLEPSRLCLPESGPAIPVKLEIIDIDHKNVCHCRFRTTENGSVERIHQYVLKRQKEILREQKVQAIMIKRSMTSTETEPNG